MHTDEITKAAASELDLDELMERIRAELAERKKLAETSAPASRRPGKLTDFAGRFWTARELLTLPAPEFARAVHLAFLGREPTPDEFVRLRDRLLVQYVGRMRILREFRASPEARQKRLRVQGFWRESAKDRIYWSPPAKFGRFVGRFAYNIYRTPRWIREFIGRVELLERRTAEATAKHRALQSTQLADRHNAGKQVLHLREQLAATKQALDSTIARRAGTLEFQLDKLARETAGELEARLSEIRTRLGDHWRAIIEQKLMMEASIAAKQGAAANAVAAARDRENSALLDALYLSFEDRYRGTREEIKERQRIYVERVAACVAATGHGAVIDVGCGRGEWLELLADSGIPARGYDLNRIAVEECRERGLDVLHADALEILSTLPDESCSAITAFHIVEHLSFETLVRLIDQSVRVLRPAGLLILETPNPANLIVAAEKFYFDPTHRNPLPSELISYLLKSRGCEEVEILPLHPVAPASPKSYDDPMLAYLQDKLFGPQDYAAIGRKRA